jgi:uncharacterized protein (DUF1015 family)
MTKNAFYPADILLPAGVDMTKWSVVACDQFTSEPDYWDRVKKTVGGSPSTLHMIVPEAYLDETDTAQSADEIGAVMRQYLDSGLFTVLENSFIYVERTLSGGGVRRGLVGVIDLEAYDFTAGSASVVRASEKTIVSRLPARIQVRRRAALELPHIMALLDDKDGRVIEPLATVCAGERPVYNFQLMEGGGSIRGWRVHGEAAAGVQKALEDLFAGRDVHIIIGDGNHSLAAAKGYWDEIKTGLDEDDRRRHPARFALVELNNVYDPAIVFEAIHRHVTRCDPKALLAALEKHLTGGSNATGGRAYRLGWVSGGEEGVILVHAPCIGDFIEALQTFLDDYVRDNGCGIDYIHGDDSLRTLAAAGGSVGLLIPAMDKSELFETVMTRGQFPKKSFSIGHARDKRYYLECRRIA